MLKFTFVLVVDPGFRGAWVGCVWRLYRVAEFWRVSRVSHLLRPRGDLLRPPHLVSNILRTTLYQLLQRIYETSARRRLFFPQYYRIFNQNFRQSPTMSDMRKSCSSCRRRISTRQVVINLIFPIFLLFYGCSRIYQNKKKHTPLNR